MQNTLKLMCILAHPDDESMGTGGVLAKYAAEGIETSLLCATRGERGWDGASGDYPGMSAFGKVREAELRAAASVLGLQRVEFLDYIDGDLDQAEPDRIIPQIASHVRKLKPQVVVTFPPDGSYGHPDHIAISQFTVAALVYAAHEEYSLADGYPPHRVSKLYYIVDSNEIKEIVAEYLGELAMDIDGVKREHVSWADWAITTKVDATDHWQTAWQAVKCHQSQVREMQAILDLAPEEVHKGLWGRQSLYRVYSLVNGGRQTEGDLFEGLR